MPCRWNIGGRFGELNSRLSHASLFFEELCQKIGGRSVVCFMVDAFGREDTAEALDKLLGSPAVSGDLLISVYTFNRSPDDPYHRKKDKSIFQ